MGISLLVGSLVAINPITKVSARGFSGGGHSFGGGRSFGGGTRSFGGSRSYTYHSTGGLTSRSGLAGTKLGSTARVSGAYKSGGVTMYKNNPNITTPNFKNNTTKGYSSGSLNNFNQFQYSKTATATKRGLFYRSPYSYTSNRPLSNATYHQTSWFGSPSFWTSYWLFYPGTHGYFHHYHYYQSTKHASSEQRNDAQANVVDDQLKLLSDDTRQQLVNQDLAYQNTDLKPRIFMITKNLDNNTTFQKDAANELKMVKYAKQALNHNGVLIEVTPTINQRGYQSVIIADSGLTKWLSDAELAKLNAKYQDALNTTDQKQVNQTLQKMNKALTKLVWAKYLKPNLKSHQAQVLAANNNKNDSDGAGLVVGMFLVIVVIMLLALVMSVV